MIEGVFILINHFIVFYREYYFIKKYILILLNKSFFKI